MAKISNRDIYAPDINITGLEYWTLTNEDGKTITLDLFDVGAFIQGNGGLQNPDGTYTWVKYAEDINGAGMKDEADSLTPYIGLAYNKIGSAESSNPNDYIFGLIDGPNFWTDENDVIHYTWIKFADTPNSGMVELPFGKAYIGLALDKTTSVETSVYSDYTWYIRNGMRSYSDQNNKVRVIDVYEDDLSSVDNIGIATWVNQNGLSVAENEIIMFNIILTEQTTEVIESLDLTKSLVLSVTDVMSTTAKLSWNPNGDAAIDRYTLVYSNIGNNKSRSIDLSAETLVYQLASLDDGMSYTAYVIAYDNNNNQKISNVVTFDTEEIFTTSTPNIAATNVTDSTINLAWNIEDVFGADSYELYQDGVKIYDGPNKTYQQTALNDDTNYQFYVIAYNGVTASNQSGTIIVRTLEAINPGLSKPDIILLSKGINSATVTADMPVLEWPRIENGGDSKIYYRVLGATAWSDVPYVHTDTINKTTIWTLASNTVYEIRIQLSDGNILSPFSDTIQVKTDAPAISVLSLTLANTDNDHGTLSISGGEPNERIEVSMYMVYIGAEGSIFIITLRADVNGTLYSVSDHSEHPQTVAERTVVFPITLDSAGKFSFVNFTLTGGYDDPTASVLGSFKVVSRSAGDLSPLNHSLNFTADAENIL